MKWIIGLDLRPFSYGALHFAAWLVSAARTSERRDLIIPVHVLEDEHLHVVLRTHHLDEVIAAARREAELTLVREGLPEAVADLQVVQGVHADIALESARISCGADATLIGRRAGREGHHITRLGRVARRTLRGARSPVVVVPPDMGGAEFGTGPIVCTAALGTESRSAVRFAEELARRTGRKLVVVHVARQPEVPYFPAGTLPDVSGEVLRDAEHELAAWIAAEGFHPDATAVLQGDIIDRVGAYAEEQGSPLVVTGARHREGLDRLLAPSIGRELAATARTPVAIVPSSA